MITIKTTTTIGAIAGNLRVLKLFRLLRIGRLLKFLDNMEFANLYRIVKLFVILFAVAHWFGCLIYFTCYMEYRAMNAPDNGAHFLSHGPTLDTWATRLGIEMHQLDWRELPGAILSDSEEVGPHPWSPEGSKVSQKGGNG